MKFDYISPHELLANPWNSNKVSKENMDKLKNSIVKFGNFKPVICRELDDGSLQILGGYHRCEAAKELSLDEIPYVNLGKLDDVKSKEITLVDNLRYGDDNQELLNKILQDIDLSELSNLAPFSFGEIEAMVSEIDCDVEIPSMDEEKKLDGKTIKLKFSDIEKAEEIEAILSRKAFDADYKYKSFDENFADALYHILVLDK